MRHWPILGVLVFLAACGASATTTQTAPSTPLSATVVAVLPTTAPTSSPTTVSSPTVNPTDTPVPTKTPEPTQATLDPKDIISFNYVASKDSGGLKLEVARIVVGKKTTLEQQGMAFSKVDAFKDYDVVGEIVFRATNTSQQNITVYPDQGTVVVGSEQVELRQWMFGSSFGQVGGEIFPGVTKIGGVWFGLKRVDVPAITKMVVAVDAPTTKDFKKLGDPFQFQLDLSKHEYQPMPADLK